MDDAGGRYVRAGRRGRRPLPTPHSRGVQDRTHHVARRTVYMVGADVPGRPPPARTRTTPVDDMSTRAAEDVGPYQRRTAVVCRAVYMVGADVLGRPPPRTHRDDAGGRCVRAGHRGRRPLPTPHSRDVQGRAHHVARRTTMRTTHLPMRDLFARLTTESNDMRPFPRRSTQATCHGVPDNIRPFLGIMGLVSYACIKETTLKAKMPRLRQK